MAKKTIKLTQQEISDILADYHVSIGVLQCSQNEVKTTWSVDGDELIAIIEQEQIGDFEYIQELPENEMLH